MNTIYLQHHGIKGQRWGVRRYQRPDGSLTPEGKKKSF
nr:MAG TPA: Phosphoserine phosphatase 1 [Caudoviricetes sp.]